MLRSMIRFPIQTIMTSSKRPSLAPSPASSKRICAASSAPTDNTSPPSKPIIFSYPQPLLPITLLKRYKRFLSDIQLSTDAGQQPTVVAHCPNTGPMTGLVDTLPSLAYVSESTVKTRKYPHTLEWINPSLSYYGNNHNTSGGVWIGCHSAKANAMVNSLLEQKLIPQLSSYDDIKKEVKYGSDGKSRVDFLLTKSADTKECIYVEVKSVTLALEYSNNNNNSSDKIAVFPDTVSVRAQKHIKELTSIAKKNGSGSDSTKAAVIFLIQRNDCIAFAPCHQKDPEYGRLVLEAADAGVLLLPIAVGLNADASGVELVDLDVPLDLMFGIQ